MVVQQGWCLEVLLGIHLDMIDFERSVGAVEFVLRTTSTLELIYAFRADRGLCDAFQLCLLLLLGKQILLLFLKEEGAVV